MDANNLSWEREKWGERRGAQRSQYSISRKQQNYYYYSENIKECRQKSGFSDNYNKMRFIKDEEIWSRGGEVRFIVAENLLKDMLKEDYGESISEGLLEPKLKISDFLNNDKKFDKNLTQTVLKVILKDGEENLFESHFRRFLALVLGTTFSTKRIDTLINDELRKNPDSDLLDLIIKFLKLCFTLLPGIAYDIFYSRVENIHLLVNAPSFNIDISVETILELEELRMLVIQSCPFKYESQNNMFSDSLEPPENFREMRIFPTKKDLLKNENQNIFLRENKCDGSYNNVDHYLDVQFRLMREDFIRPLREGVKDHKNKMNKCFNIRVYKNVRILSSVPDKKFGILRNIQLDKSRLTRVNWSESKRFMHGCLLCFSYDSFNTFILATVAKRNENDIKEGILSVKFIDEGPQDYRDYTLLESTNLFESYRYVLARLQDLNEDNLCMKDYLVYNSKKMKLPSYLVRNPDMCYEFKDKVIRPGDEDEIWPQAVDLGMNESQFQAFKSALTKEMTIIQGPPGTGKTYLGLQICECLLKNVQSKLENFGPILIVCYTNHALDQFLEGISEFTYKIVRIGGGCKSERILCFSLQEKRKNFLDFSRNHPDYEELEYLEAELEFRRNSHQALISLERLQNVISKEDRDYFVSVRIDLWLKGESSNENWEVLDSSIDQIVGKIIDDEILRNLKPIVLEAFNEPISNRRSDFDNLGDFENFFPQPSYEFTRLKDKMNKNLIKVYLKKQTKMSSREAAAVQSLDNLSLTNRWRLYRYWRSLYVILLKETTKETEDKYDELCKRINDVLLEEDGEVMKVQDVIGMTTTGAAKYGKILEKIGCKIIIVEEAAEVIESHVIASLNSSCEHLILIGDHKQLRPNPAVYELSKKYALDISLFERLLKNNLKYKTLSTQHRMRPEISEIMRFIYDDLHDHDSVLHYPNVPAMKSNILFFNHFEPEEFHEETLSYSNRFEVDLILRFCRHLLGNGVKGTQITILTLYSGQSFLFNSLMNEGYDDVRVSVVDNYQGEENDIILLSLVRSNEYEQIGFLNIENRICVSLSRAKHGLFVFGNFDILMSKNKMWKKICEFLEEKDLLKKSLDMFCQNHQEKQLSISVAKDFDKYPDCGCEEKCGKLLSCGHICVRYCHYMDRDHLQYECLEDCPKLCVNNHPCKRRCHERCGNCHVEMEKKIPFCNHNQVMKCYKEAERRDCKNACERVLPCGHICSGLCGDECLHCMTKVQRTSDCGHFGEYPCHIVHPICLGMCDFLLKCGHRCTGRCGICLTEQSHKTCNENCRKLLLCGHAKKVKYIWYEYQGIEDIAEGCSHSEFGFPCRERCYDCEEQCQWKCEHKECMKMCKDMCDREVCNEGCKNSVTCVYCAQVFNCYGICGERCREVCRECDKEVKEDNLYVTLWTCGHCFELSFLDEYMFSKVKDCEITRKICPACSVIINKRSTFRYMNVVRRISKYIEEVKKEITEEIESFEYSSYYRILNSLKSLITEMFEYFGVDDYFGIEGVGSSYCDSKVDSLYDLYFSGDNPLRHILVYKCRSSVVLLYTVYKHVIVPVGLYSSSLSKEVRISVKNLLEWLNPQSRNFDDLDIEKFTTEMENIVKLMKEGLDCVLIEDSQACSTSFYKPSTKLEEYLGNIFMKGFCIMRGFNFVDRSWFKCSRGHVYNKGQSLQTPPRCPRCYPNSSLSILLLIIY